MLIKKGTIVTKEKLFRFSSLLASDSSLTDHKRIPGGLSKDKGVGYAYAEHAEQHERTAPGGRVYPDGISGEPLCPERLLDRGLRARALCAGPMG